MRQRTQRETFLFSKMVDAARSAHQLGFIKTLDDLEETIAKLVQREAGNLTLDELLNLLGTVNPDHYAGVFEDPNGVSVQEFRKLLSDILVETVWNYMSGTRRQLGEEEVA
jgi:hypothetical protein